MRGTLHISLLAATLSPSLVQSSPIPFVQNYNSSPRSSSQALSDSSRPGGVFSGRSPLTHGGSRSYGLGLLDLGSSNGGNGGDASSGSSYAQGGYVPNFFFAIAVRSGHNTTYDRDYPGNYDDLSDHLSDGGDPPAIDLGPSKSGDPPQPGPEQEPSESDADPKPDMYGPGDPAPSPPEPDTSINPDEGNKSTDTGQDAPLQSSPGSAQPYPPPADTGESPPSPKQEPEPGESPSDLPIFLGPTNNYPPPEGHRPPSSSPQGSGYPDEEESYKHPKKPPYETSCDEYVGGSLINLLSNNGGDGGDASSGAATRQELTSVSIHLLTCP
jgi:hypothetical protein